MQYALYAISLDCRRCFRLKWLYMRAPATIQISLDIHNDNLLFLLIDGR